MNATWTGTIIRATTIRKIVSRNGNLQPREGVRRQRADVSGSSVDGTEMIRLFRNAWPIPAR